MPRNVEDKYDTCALSLSNSWSLGALTDFMFDSYLPSILRYFNPNGQLHQGVNLSVECTICKAGLAITQPADDDHEKFTMLPCGHIYCYNCVTQWFLHKANCPQCRKNMRHAVCGHRVAIRAMQGGPNFNIRRDLGPRLREVSHVCTKCRHRNRNRQAFLNRALNQRRPHELPRFALQQQQQQQQQMQHGQAFLRQNIQYPALPVRNDAPQLLREAGPPPLRAYHAPEPQPQPQLRPVNAHCPHCQRQSVNRPTFYVHPYARIQFGNEA
ncbi:hypothetical protein F4679DRAFT_594048 [Xylaria curta]|nr:hypothetical protein F4679DRAFT_594048 [Xylaria curta]